MKPSWESDILIDPLTGLYHRRGFQVRLEEEYCKAKSLQLPLSLLAIDLDLFEKVNEEYFVPGGDAIIMEMGRLITSRPGANNLVGRDGGDQFSLILPETDNDSACREAERLRLAIELFPFELRKERVYVTASVGVATATFTENEPWDLYVRARKAVHRAKDSGRNQVVVG